MGLVSKTVKTRWVASTKKHYESLGYVFTKIGDEFEVRVEDLPKGSNVKVKCVCDGEGCGKELSYSYRHYNRYVKENKLTYCHECAVSLYGTERMLKSKVKKTKSFYDWCIEHEYHDIVSRWDYEENGCSPKDVCYSSNKKYWFKCDKHAEHKSELKDIVSFISGNEGLLKCRQCNSFAQYLINTFPNKTVEDFWDYEKNTLDPWDIPSQKNEKVWIKCQEKDYHGSYEIDCSKFVGGRGCPYCSRKSGKIHPKDSLGQYIIDNYGEDFLHKVWSDKNDKTPFEYACMTHKKVWWKCPKGEHEDFLRSCYSSVDKEFRCPDCVKKIRFSSIEKKTKLYLEKIGYCVFTELDCTITPINPKTKSKLPYDNEIILLNGKHLIIEVHGGQHYDNGFYKTRLRLTDDEAEEKLKQRKLYDRYKKYIAWKNNYEYLELPYWSFEGKNKDLYKQMIDNKIKEILEKEDEIA